MRHHFAPCATSNEAFDRLRSVQFDPIAPAGCNHDLVLQARVLGYKVGDWEKLAYEDRVIYDGWDKQACLVPFEGWPLRRIFHFWRRNQFEPMLNEYSEAVQVILKDLAERGPLLPKECGFQEKRSDWSSVWHSSNVTKRVLNALWHKGLVMTAGRRKGQILYDLTERIVPPHLYAQPILSELDSIRELVLERHRAVGMIRPSAPYEVWSYVIYAPARTVAINELIERNELVAVDVDGMKAHATPHFLSLLDLSSLAEKVIFVAPLDQLLWDRKMIAHTFDFEYAWEIYVPGAKRRWGYYVLPVLFGNDLVARVEFWCREGTLEIRRWHFEAENLPAKFYEALKQSLQDFMRYCSATRVVADVSIDARIKDLIV